MQFEGAFPPCLSSQMFSLEQSSFPVPRECLCSPGLVLALITELWVAVEHLPGTAAGDLES